MKFQDLTGIRFGRLTVLERAENRGNRVCWRCKCDCGNLTTVCASLLKSGNTSSCGCYHKQRTSEACFQDLKGQRFGKLTVTEYIGKGKDGKSLWQCHCECGNVCIVSSSHLKSGTTKSCGCLKHIGYNTIHALTNSKIYRIWNGIKGRCFNTKDESYLNYGGRGIILFPDWVHNFKAFYDYVSKLPHFGEEGYSLDRIDNNGNYEPNNLRWATKKEQSRNTRQNVWLEYRGKLMILSDVAELIGISPSALKKRYKRGDRGERLFRPVEKKTNPPQHQLFLPF